MAEEWQFVRVERQEVVVVVAAVVVGVVEMREVEVATRVTRVVAEIEAVAVVDDELVELLPLPEITGVVVFVLSYPFDPVITV